MVADTELARTVLGWTPRFGLRDMADHALAWERKLAKMAPSKAEMTLAPVGGELTSRIV